MQVFVDSIGQQGLYRVKDAPSWLSPELPIEVLLAVGLAEGSMDLPMAALGDSEPAGGALLYHVESGRYLTGTCFLEAGVRDLDTVVVVRPQNGRFLDCARIDKQWHRAGGGHRKARFSGMHIKPRRDPFDANRTLH